ncbi:hypothetical protein Cgig2_025964 [Carnegiea gigantea]|uniref:Uncharacterized protein n=1 Tax=Carnegiea gigantea TaxID=171969 RepID=A0A9Q1QA11_9CARY|nr:hypothetical protein Cgig2_025964 [Carnegiea gigantea]
MTMVMAMAMSSILSATPTYNNNNNNNNRVIPVVRSASLKTLPLASTSRFLRDNNHGLHYNLKALNPGLRPRKHIRAANDSAQPAPPPPPTAPSDPSPTPTGRKEWIAGIMITLLLPFLKSKWGPLLLFKDKFDTELQKVDAAVEAVENVAEGVEKAAEDLAEKLPNGSRLKNAADVVEHAAEKVAKDAHLADAAIHKVYFHLH